MKELLALPWQFQVVIVGGYFAYVVAFAGKRSSHKSVDTLSIILCFGGIALLTFEILEGSIPQAFAFCNVDLSESRGFLVAGGAIAAAITSAVVWRRFLGAHVGKALRRLSNSDDDGLHFGWETLIQQPGLDYNQISVSLKDGRILESYPLSRFDHFPNGPCILGGDGSVALYVTHIENEQGGRVRRETNNLVSFEEGARMTYIPADQIAEVDVRRKFKSK